MGLLGSSTMKLNYPFLKALGPILLQLLVDLLQNRIHLKITGPRGPLELF